MKYSNGMKARMVERMSGPNRISASRLAKEVGIPQTTLSRWLHQASAEKIVKTNGHLAERLPVRPDDLPAAEKFRLVMEASALSDDELGEFLRREGIHESQLNEWRKKVEQSAARARSVQARAKVARDCIPADR